MFANQVRRAGRAARAVAETTTAATTITVFLEGVLIEPTAVLGCCSSTRDSLPQNLAAKISGHFRSCFAAEQTEQRHANICRQTASYDEADSGG
jgi:hypothetical protein